MAGTDLSKAYGEQYFQGYYERSPKWFNFFNQIADCLIEQFEPKSHLDAGCAWGLLVEVLRERGVESFGIDFSPYALKQVHADVQQYCRQASLTEPITGGPYDLVTCIEVLEHLEEADSLRAIENLTAVTDVILFSSTPDGFDDPTHLNVQPLIYWLRAFARHGFYPIAKSDAIFVAEQAFIVRRSAAPKPEQVLEMFAQIMELRTETRRLAGQVEAGEPPSDALNEILASPAWRLISRYRSWLAGLHEQRPGLFKAWDRTARLGLQSLITDTMKKAAPTAAGWDYAKWITENEPSESDLTAQVSLANGLGYRPKISVVMPVYKISPEILGEAIESLRRQTYDNWELCASVIPRLNLAAAALLDELSAKDSRIRVCKLDSNLGISGNSNRALEKASGEYIALLDHDDTLSPFALYEVARLLNEDPAANFIYSDRDEITEDGATRSYPFFKPGWSPEILMTANYLTHVCVMRTEHVRDVGGWRSEMDGAQDWDLFLRLTTKYGGVRHIPKILYHWRHAPSSVSATGLAGKPYAREAQVHTVESYCRSSDLQQSVVFHAGKPKILWRLSELPSVTIIVLSRDMGKELTEKARWIAQRPECVSMEIVCATDGSAAESGDGVKFVSMPSDTDIVDQMDRLVRASAGEVMAFVDVGIHMESGTWLRELVGPLLLPGVGLSGCQLEHQRSSALYQIGIAFDDEGNATRVRAKIPRSEFLHGWNYWLRNWCAVSGACFAIRRSTWDEVGGFSSPNGHSLLDVRLCLKLAEKGLRVVNSPAVQLRQTGTAALEHPLRSQDEEDRRIVRRIFPNGDPYINPNLRLVDGFAVPR